MHFTKQILSLSIFLSVISNNAISQNISFSGVPSWVVKQEIPENYSISAYELNAGYYSLLTSHQYNELSDEDYTQDVLRVVNNAGVQQVSKLLINVDTSYQVINFHHLKIYRNNDTLDQTNAVDFKPLNQENQLSNDIYTGRTTAFHILNDVRVGDLVEYAYTIKGHNPIFKGNVFSFTPVVSINPAGRYHTMSILDNKIHHQITCKGYEEEIKIDTTKEHVIVSLIVDNVEAWKMEETVPSWDLSYPYISISSFKNWNHVKLWADDVFKQETKPNFEEAFQEIFEGNREQFNIEKQISKIIDFVQDDIRYMGVEAGIGAFKPFAPNQVLTQRFGDCKDKSLLLSEMLQAIGVSKAGPALVNASMTYALPKMLPSAHLFNHCIVWFEWKGKTYWIDPTIPLQGGDFKHKFTPDFGYALRINHDKEGELERVAFNPFDSKTSVVEYIVLPNFTEPGKFEVTTTYTGNNADYIRTLFNYYSPKAISESLRNNYSRLYTGIVADKDIVVDDDKNSNVFVLRESYSIHDGWESLEYQGEKANQFRYEPISLYSVLNTMQCEEKKFDVVVPFPLNYEQTTRIYYPKSLSFESLEDLIYNNAAYNFNRKLKVLASKNGVLLTYDFKTKTRTIKPEEFIGLCAKNNKTVNNLAFLVYFPANK